MVTSLLAPLPHNDKPVSERVVIKDDELVIDGVRFSGPAIDFFVNVSEPGTWFRIIEVTDCVTIQQKREDDAP